MSRQWPSQLDCAVANCPYKSCTAIGSRFCFQHAVVRISNSLETKLSVKPSVVRQVLLALIDENQPPRP